MFETIKTISKNLNEHFELAKKHHPKIENIQEIVKKYSMIGGKKKNKKIKKRLSKNKNKKQKKTKKNKKYGGSVNGPYASLMNDTEAYARFGSPGVKYWENGTNIEGKSHGGPTVKACK